MTDPSHITQAQAARRLGTSHTNVGNLIARNRLESFVFEGTIMVPLAQVDAYKAEMGGRRAPRAQEAAAPFLDGQP